MEATWWTKPEQLDDRQKQVLALDRDGDHLVFGPPGSGKTNLLLLRAAYLHKINRRNFVVLTYGRVLREFLATGAEYYPFTPDRLKTFAAWAAALSRNCGIQVPVTNSETVNRANLVVNLKKIIQIENFTRLDCLLVDEAQDYTPEEIDLMIALSERVFFVGDDRQEIYGKKGGLHHLKATIPSNVQLIAHYRNGLKICRVADKIFNELDDEHGLEASSQYDEISFPSTVFDHGGLSTDEQVAMAVDEIANQLIAYPSGFIGVLCPRNVDLNDVSQKLGLSAIKDSVQVQKYVDGYSAFTADRRVVVTTLHGAKGLEFRAVHIMSAEEVSCFRERMRRVVYTAVTRAKTYLAVYHNGALPGFFDGAMTCAEIQPIPDPSIDELFL